ncbi:DUF6879 family protein [Nonomuraea sp. NPDC046802]|uniref:DUF6879 family protein n=1 Tax=Nonomuraea sp. NPDC046802 TaxID=3154919 RepID=UPI0033EB5ED8
MKLITPDQRDELFDTFRRDAFHLELRDQYGVAREEGPFARWLRGEPDDLTWLWPWLDRVRGATAAGRTVRRVRVITESASEYIRWEHSLTPATVEAGEDIRWLPRHRMPAIELPMGGDDWWLFDDRLLAVGRFGEDGQVLGSELVTDPTTVARCAGVRDLLWALAIPHHEYKLI